jgi:hypothetical protein
MKTNTASAASGINVSVVVLGILAMLLVFAVLTGRKVPFLASEQATLLALVVIGMFICSQAGIGQVAARGAWWHPISVVGYLLGAAIIAIGIAALFGRHIPPLTSYHQSFIAVTVIAVIKVVLTTIHRLFW